jgi:uncharacterized protein (TIRG00374 family)
VPNDEQHTVAAGQGRLALRRLLRIALVAISAVFLVRFVGTGWPEVVSATAALPDDQSGLLAAALLLEVAWTLSLAQVYRSAVAVFSGVMGTGDALRLSMAAFTISRLLPGGGATGSVYAARQLIALGHRPFPVVMSLIVSWWAVMTSMVVLVLAGTAISAATERLPASYVVVPGAAVFVFLVGAFVLVTFVRRPRLQVRLVRVINGVGQKLGVGLVAADDEPGKVVSLMTPRRLVKVTLWGTAGWVLDAAALWVVFAAFGHRLDVGILMVGYGVMASISALPELTPGWLGVMEASLALTYAALGVPEGTAVVAVLIYRIVSYWLPVAAGVVPAAAVLRRKKTPIGSPPILEEAAA